MLARTLTLALLLLSVSAIANTLTGKGVKVVDGDAVYVLDSANEQHKIRLARTGAPERGQPFGTKAKEHLARLVAGDQVKVDWYKLDRYGQRIGIIRLGSLDVNLEMLRAGLAWHFKRYAAEQPEGQRESYATAETLARAARKGLWVDDQPIAPWDTGGAVPDSLSRPSDEA